MAVNSVLSFREALRVWARIGVLSFGGPAGQIALMHRELVEERRWIDDARFLHALQFCMLLPGPEAQQLATYVGFLLHGTRGAIAAGTLFVLPGALVILALALAYATMRELPGMGSIFAGLAAAVIAIVIEAVVRIAKRALPTRVLVSIAVISFVAIFVLGAPFPLIVLGAGLTGIALGRFAPQSVHTAPRAEAKAPPTVLDEMATRGELGHAVPSRARALRVVAVSLALWSLPLVLTIALGAPRVLRDEAIFFSQMALVTFGGAYAALAWVAQQAVEGYGWLTPAQMIDALALAETTPGPLILVLEMVGALAAYQHAAGMDPIVAAMAGAAITLWVTFVPCFLWILALAPWIESLREAAALRAALAAITASVVGVIANLSAWFGLHALFGEVEWAERGPVRWPVPELASFDPVSAVIALACGVALMRFKAPMPAVLLAAALSRLAIDVARRAIA